MWSDVIPYLFQIAVIVLAAGALTSAKAMLRLLKLPEEFKSFESDNAEDHAAVRASVQRVSRGQDKLGVDMLTLREKQAEHAIELAKHEVRLSQIDHK